MNLPEIDTLLFFAINKNLQNGLFDIVMPWITNNVKLIFLLLSIWAFVRHGKRSLQVIAVALAAVAIADSGGNLLKILIARPRPFTVLENVHLLVGKGGAYSMPSGHMSNTTALAAGFFFMLRDRLGYLFLAVAALVGFSRVYVGVHYPFDVAAGALLGISAAAGAILLVKKAASIYEKKEYEKALYLALLVISAFRIYYILTCPYDLTADEAHYWEWSRRPDLSYYSKGPMIAWIIYAGTALFGSTVFGIRICAVILSALSSIFLYRTGKGLYDEKTGLASGLLMQVVPLYSVFGVLLTIDSPFIFFWTLSLMLFLKAARPSTAEGPSEGKKSGFYWILFGIVAGLGLLTKYTMVFFYLSAFLYLVTSRELRRHLVSPWPYLSGIISLIVFSPVIYWNAEHAWVTVRHTAGQAHVADGFRISFLSFLEFLGSQVGIITPLLFVMLVIATWKMRKDKGGAFLFWFSAPTVAFFLAKSLQGKVQANWALTGYASAFIAFAAYYVRNLEASKRSLKRMVAAAVILAFAITALAYYPKVLHLPDRLDPAKKLAGWKELGIEADKAFSEMPAGAPVFVFSGSYQISSELAFYLKGHPVTYCANLGRRMNQYDLWPGFEGLKGYNALFIDWDEIEMPEQLAKAFSSYERQVLTLHTRQSKIMKFTLFKCYDFRGMEIKPAERY